MTDLRQGVTPAGHDVLDALDRLRGATDKDATIARQLRMMSSYAGIQLAGVQGMDAPAEWRRRMAIEGAAALIRYAELIDGKD